MIFNTQRWKRIRPTDIWGRGVTAAHRTLNPPGEGSSPSGPTDRHWSSSGKDTGLLMRRRGFESRPVLIAI